MFSKISIFRTLSVLIVIVLMSSTASARPLDPPPPLGTGFTYQGRLTDGGAPANGTYDFEVTLYYALSSVSPVGSTVTQGDVTVTNGLFTVLLDFGDVFDGTARYLEIGVRPGASVGAYTPLVPRQALTATPYAIYAEKAPWNGITGMPAGFADGVDNGSSYQNVKVVAKSGGDFTSIQAALDSITTNSTSNRYLVWVAPGVYNEQVTMKPFVDIEGAGEGTTKITFTGSTGFTTGTLVGASDAELRFLTVENTGGATGAVAIYNSSASPRLTHVTANGSGGTYNIGVYNVNSSPTMTSVTASATGGTNNYGVYNYASSSPAMTGVTASASGGTSVNYGVFNDSSSPTINNSVISGSGGTYNSGIYNYAGSGSNTVRVNNSQVSGSNSTIYNYGLTTRVGASQLSGGAVDAGVGTLTCAGVYDENYSFYASTCP